MTTQLRLIDHAEGDFRLDERTKAIGRVGLARARAALRDAQVPGPGAVGTDTSAQTRSHAA